MQNWLFTVTLFVMASTSSVAAQTRVSANEVVVEGITTQVRTYRSEELTEQPVLLVALHGDAPFNNPSYQYAFARLVAKEVTNAIAIGLLRPGYTDDEGRTSDGVRGATVGTNYDAPRIEQIAAAIAQLKTHHKADKLILAGHSGGSAITGKLIATYPGLVDHAVIVSCPCDINPWRKDMFENTQYDGFKGDLDVVSPIDVVSSIANDTSISLFVGRGDQSTRPYLSHQYLARLHEQGTTASLTLLDGEHNIFLHPQIRSTLISIIDEMNTPSP